MSTLSQKLPISTPAAAGPAPRASYRKWIEAHPVAAFFAFAYAFSWLLWVAPVFGLRGALGGILLYVGVMGPAIAAATITRLTGGSLRGWLRELVRFRAPARWYAAIIVFPIVLVLATNAAFALTGGDIDTGVLGERLATYLPAFVIWTLATMGEEPGWRGFALPRLQERLTPVRATLLLGSLWALWHLPLLAAADEPSHGLDPLPLVGVSLLAVAAIVGYAFLYTTLWNRTRNVWLAILLHGSLSGAIAGFVLVPTDDDVGGTYAHLQAATVAVVAVAALVLVRATRGRLGLAGAKVGASRSMLTGLLAFLAVLAFAGAAGAAEPSPATTARIDRFVEQQMDARQVPGFALAIVRGGELVHARGFGSADGSGRKVTAETPFVLGSTTKSFTALAVMLLVDSGKVSLDAPISDYLPELRLAADAERQITVRHLLNQTSGLPGLAGGRLLRSVGDGTLLDVVRELEGTKLAADPGTHFEYANANYVLLGLVVERASGERYGAYVERHIFEPLGMRHSFASPEAAEAAGLAVGHRYWFGFPIEHGPTTPAAMAPAGSLISSAGDMARYLAMYLNGGVLDGRRIISRDALETMLRPAANGHLGAWADNQETRYGMGWFVGGPWDEPALLHAGGEPDSSSMIVLLPKQRLAVVTLANANLELPLPGGDGSLDRIPRGVVSLLVGEQPETGISFARFYIAFDSAAVLLLGLLVCSAARLVRRRRQVVHGWRLAARALRASAEAGTGLVLLAAPVLVGQGHAGALLWWPDLTVVLLALGGLLVMTGGARLVVQALARRRAAPADARQPAAHSHPRTVAGRTRLAPRPIRRRPQATMRGVENDASAENR